MTVSAKDWAAYIKRLSALNAKAAAEMRKYIQVYGFADMDGLIRFAYALATKYGEGAAALSAAMYEGTHFHAFTDIKETNSFWSV